MAHVGGSRRPAGLPRLAPPLQAAVRGMPYERGSMLNPPPSLLLPLSAVVLADGGGAGAQAAGVVFGVLIPVALLALSFYLVLKHLALVVRGGMPGFGLFRNAGIATLCMCLLAT